MCSMSHQEEAESVQTRTKKGWELMELEGRLECNGQRICPCRTYILAEGDKEQTTEKQ